MGIEILIENGKIKSIASVDLEKLKDFRNKHDGHYEKKSTASPNDTYSLTYTRTSIETKVEINCYCGESEDITDYSMW